MRINLPNQITLARMGLAVAFFAALAGVRLGADGSLGAGSVALVWLAFTLFLLSAIGDAIDGHIARRFQQETGFGRVIDPFVDKMLVLGGFVFLLGDNFSLAGGGNAVGLAPWMVTLILGRELLVSVLRGVSERGGVKFGADWVGKVKTTLQFIALGACVLRLLGPGAGDWLAVATRSALWLAVVFTLYSMLSYLWRARALLTLHHDDERALAATPAAHPS